jgi:MarR family transcriptional regulator for hemolysin
MDSGWVCHAVLAPGSNVTLAPIADKMEKDGLVIRKVDSDDRRNNRIYRTEKADKLWDKMLECALKIRQISVKDIPEKNINIMRNVLECMQPEKCGQ